SLELLGRDRRPFDEHITTIRGVARITPMKDVVRRFRFGMHAIASQARRSCMGRTQGRSNQGNTDKVISSWKERKARRAHARARWVAIFQRVPRLAARR